MEYKTAMEPLSQTDANNWNVILQGVIITVFAALIIAIGGIIWKQRNKLWKLVCVSWYKLVPQTQVITFAISHNDQLNSGLYYEEIKKSFLKNLKNYELSKFITYKDFSDIFLFTDNSEAEKFRNVKDLDLILWGEFLNDHLKRGGHIESEFSLNYTYGINHQGDNELEVKQKISERINAILSVKNKWLIRDNDSLDDVSDVADCFFSTSLFVLGLTLGNRGEIERSTFIFEKLYKYLEDKGDKLSQQLIPYIRDCYTLILSSLANKNKRNWDDIVSICEKLIEINPGDLFALTNLAHGQYQLGQITKSIEISQSMIDYDKKSGAARVNLAFFQAMAKNYTRALHHYKLLLTSRPDFNSLEIIEFLNSEYKKTKEPALIFASGFISHFINGDDDLAREDFIEFMKNATEEKYGPMYREAERICKKILA